MPLPRPRGATLGRVSGPADRQLLPRLGLVEATLVVMGGIVGSGIFINPSVVARHVHSGPLILGAWLVGGAVALVGAFIYAELAERMPRVGGQYAYLREAFHPVVGFLYGWALLVVINAGGTAAVAVTFGRYAVELTGSALDEKLIAVLTLVLLAGINCLGVKSGSLVQGGLMVLKIGVLLTLIVLGLLLGHAPPPSAGPHLDGPLAFGGAMVPVLFAYGGWQTANFIAAEVREPRRNLPRALVAGVIGVVVLYLGANWVYLRGLGPEGLAATGTPASSLMRGLLGDRGATFIALGIAISTLRLPQPLAPDHAPGLLRDGRGRRLLPGRGPGLRAHPRAGGRHRPPGGARHRRCPLGPVRADPRLRGLGGLGVLRPLGGLALRAPEPCHRRTGHPLPGPRPSVHHRGVRRRLGAGRPVHRLGVPDEHAHRPGAGAGRAAGLRALDTTARPGDAVDWRSFALSEPRNVLVTGASSGLGRALALWFARRGASVWAAARRTELLDTLAADPPSARPGSIVPLALDVSSTAAIRRVLPEVDGQADGGLDVVIANAGIGGEANPRKDTWEKVERMIQVNVTGAAATLATLAPRMAERGRGHLVGMSSLAAWMVTPKMGVYSATKAFLAGLLRWPPPRPQERRGGGHLHPPGLREERDDGEEQVQDAVPARGRRRRRADGPRHPPRGEELRLSRGPWSSPPAPPGSCPTWWSPG